MNRFIKTIILSVIVLIGQEVLSQNFKADLQLRPRYEYRNGYKELMKDGEYPNSLVTQRSRLNLNFANEKLETKLSLQNIRTWGDVPTTAQSDKNGIAIYEAWASYELAPNWTGKIGRQTLIYDNQRILGGIDWAQQGQSHDALLVSYQKDKNQLDVAVALNANGGLYELPYATNYKNMQLVWYHRDFSNLQMSLLALNNGYQYEDTSEEKLKIAYLQTFGTYLKWSKSAWNADFSAYIQTGETAWNQNKAKVSAYYFGLNLGYAINDQLKAEIGTEYLSGTDQGDSSGKIKSFNPLFGTNHAFNGFMDYFYVGNHKINVGLHDIYAKLNYNINQWQFTLSPHLFSSTNKIYNPTNSAKMDNYLGTEIDFVVGYKVSNTIKLNGGYSQMFGTDSLESLKGGNKGYDNNWAWVMISFNPELLNL